MMDIVSIKSKPKEVSESQGSPSPHIPPFGLSQAFYLLPVFGVASSQEIVPEGDEQTLRANVLDPPLMESGGPQFKYDFPGLSSHPCWPAPATDCTGPAEHPYLRDRISTPSYSDTFS